MDRIEVKRKMMEFFLGKQQLHMKETYNSGYGETVSVKIKTLDELEADIDEALTAFERKSGGIVSIFDIGDFELDYLKEMSHISYGCGIIIGEHPDNDVMKIYWDENADPDEWD